MIVYFYSNTKNKEQKNKYTVYKVYAIKNNLDIAERRARTIARKNKDNLAGGMFIESCKPYNFKEDYTIIAVPLSTRVAPYNAKDKFIINLIKAENNMQYTIL